MKKFEKVLFFYSIVAITVFLISFGVFSPAPLNLLSGVLLFPMIFYFWLRLTSPQNTSPDIWSIRFVASLVILALLGIFGFYLASKGLPEINSLTSKVADLEAQNQKISNDLESKNTEVSRLKASPPASPSATVKGTSSPDLSVADLVAGTPAPGSAQRITGNAGLTNIDVYETPSSTSAKIGSIQANITYPYITKQNSWYKIVVTSTTTGWVSANQVQEVN